MNRGSTLNRRHSPATSTEAPTQQRKRVGVIGSFVWDVIHGRDPRDAPVEEWGGITYALGALEAALPGDWEFVPIAKVGYDLAPRARDFLKDLSKAAPDAAPIEVPHPNNRVTLHYQSEERRCEHLSGGVPGWSWLGLKPLLADLDALYINLISGFELDLETAQLIRAHFKGPVYIDMHSLFLARQPDGLRTLQPLQNPEAWFRCFDIVQVNEDEMSMMAPDPLALAAMATASGVKLLAVTLGSRGAVYFAEPGFETLKDLGRDRLGPATGAIRTELIPAIPTRDLKGGDPTGCGDVWGATYFSRLLAGEDIRTAMTAAGAAAARNVDHRGATGLAQYLRGELSVK
ncbi:MAG TPA: carbohydrate kinase family protein [Gemmatimonadaceae bacterium]|nr:carbohydrate kinase family protein [Gemmatimonadaceae bacterium]